MNTIFLRSILTTLLLVVSVTTWGYNVKVDGLYYNLNTTAKTASVTYKTTSYKSYSGLVSIPETFVSGGVTYSVTSIGEYAFDGCTSLTSVTIGKSVTSIGNYAFDGCTGLTSVSIPNSVTSIGSYAFYKCSGLTSVTIGNSVTIIGSYAFYKCSGLTSVTIGNSVTRIGSYAFESCSGLTSVTIGNSVTSIGSEAFRACSGLTSVTIPNSVTRIGSEAFRACSGLTSVSVESGNQKYDSRDNCNAIIETASNTLIAGCENTVIPNSVTSIENNAFYGCTGLTSVTIPNSVTSIGKWAFYFCPSLISVYNYATTPQTLSSFRDFSNAANCTLYVPKASIDTYKAADYWKEFKEILAIEDEPSAIISLNSDNTKPSNMYYNLSGRKFSAPHKGLNIVNGKKVIY